MKQEVIMEIMNGKRFQIPMWSEYQWAQYRNGIIFDEYGKVLKFSVLDLDVRLHPIQHDLTIQQMILEN